MVTLTSQSNSVKFSFTDNDHYLFGTGEIEVPINSLYLVLDESDMVTFSKIDGDPFISFRADNSNLGSKSAIETFYKNNMVGSTGGGGGGEGISSAQCQTMIDESISGKADSSAVTAEISAAVSGLAESSAVTEEIGEALEDYYDKDEVDAGFASIQDEIDEKEEVISTSLNDLNDRMDDKAEATAVTALNSSLTAHTSNSDIHTTAQEKAAWNAKQNALTAGTGIEINNDVISVTASTGGSNVIELTQAQYNALVDKDPDVIYVITDAPEINLSGYAQSSAVTAVNDALTAHTANTNIHTTAQEKSTWTGKQDALVSGTNIKTINNQSLLGSGNIDIQGGGGGISSAQCQAMIDATVDPKEEVVATALNDLNDRVEDLETGGTGVTIATAITSSSTNSEAAGALATYNAITAATTGGGATYSAGTNISIDTANTISCTLNLSNGSKDKSIKAGRYVDANNYAEVSFGYYNKSNGSSSNYGNNSGSTLFSIGNGYGVVATQRHNAFEIRQNGDIYCSNGTSDVKLQDYLQVKVVKISQSDYDALVQGGTVDSNTLYIITNVVS